MQHGMKKWLTLLKRLQRSTRLATERMYPRGSRLKKKPVTKCSRLWLSSSRQTSAKSTSRQSRVAWSKFVRTFSSTSSTTRSFRPSCLNFWLLKTLWPSYPSWWRFSLTILSFRSTRAVRRICTLRLSPIWRISSVLATSQRTSKALPSTLSWLRSLRKESRCSSTSKRMEARLLKRCL